MYLTRRLHDWSCGSAPGNLLAWRPDNITYGIPVFTELGGVVVLRHGPHRLSEDDIRFFKAACVSRPLLADTAEHAELQEITTLAHTVRAGRGVSCPDWALGVLF